jgi:Alpha/beta hydrolase domain
MTDRTTRAKLDGPVTGGAHGWPFGRPLFDLADRGYIAEEFFLTGEAKIFDRVPGTEWGRDGHWQVEPTGTVPFVTRLLVYRPIDPQRFNHTVVVSWNNVTAGYELFGGESDEIFEGGFAFVGATVQHVGIHGFPTNSQGLAAWDPERYSALHISTDDASYDIFTQVAQAVGSLRDVTGVDPLGGLDVHKVIGLGASQSAGRLSTYLNAIHPNETAFDGFLLQIYFGTGSALAAGTAIINIGASTNSGSRAGLSGTNLIRDDLDVPVMVINSELEAISCFPVRQPDTERFRYWESAGTSHTAIQTMAVRSAKYEREFQTPLPVEQRMNRINITPLYDSALHYLNRWVNGGEPPPRQPLIEFAGEPPEVVRDEHGIATGGIRLPQADVPVAHNSAIPLGPDIFSLLRGSSEPFGAAKLDALYSDEVSYVAQFTAAAQMAEATGVLLARDVAPLIEEAGREYRRSRES